MHVIHIDNLTVSYAARQVFQDLSWHIGDRDRIGLVGPNGAGKSILLRVICGEVIPEAGTVTFDGDLSVGLLQQDIELPAGKTLLQAAMVLPPRLSQLETQLNHIESRLSDPAVYSDERKLSNTLIQQEQLLSEYERLGVAQHESRVKRTLSQLGFDESHYDLTVESLSGGQKKLVALTILAMESPDVLMLDEPDNHLDTRAKHQLEKFIHAYAGAVIIISHDRYLLDECVTHIAELASGKLTSFVGNYTAFTTARELARLRQEQAYVTQQKQIAQIEAAIARFELWASMVIDERHIKQARSRRKMLDRMEERGEIIEKVRERKMMNLQLEGGRGSKNAITLENLSMVFDDNPIFLDLNLLVRHGERVGLIGPNGSGKSVLFKLIKAEFEAFDGEVKVGPSTRIGYYAQEHQTLTDYLDMTPIDMVQKLLPIGEGEAVAKLLKFAFDYEQTRQPIHTMSGGERSRLQLLKIMIEQPNLLLLDEPTNNLDIQSVELLEKVLEDFEGAIFTISHDRYFLDNVVDKVVELRDGELTEYLGGYTDYVESQK